MDETDWIDPCCFLLASHVSSRLLLIRWGVPQSCPPHVLLSHSADSTNYVAPADCRSQKARSHTWRFLPSLQNPWDWSHKHEEMHFTQHEKIWKAWTYCIIFLSSYHILSELQSELLFSVELPGSLPCREGGPGYVRRDRLCEITSDFRQIQLSYTWNMLELNSKLQSRAHHISCLQLFFFWMVSKLIPGRCGNKSSIANIWQGTQKWCGLTLLTTCPATSGRHRNIFMKYHESLNATLHPHIPWIRRELDTCCLRRPKISTELQNYHQAADSPEVKDRNW